MGRSRASCFKIMACGSDSANQNDDLEAQAPETKGSSDKRGWSFRKKSASHRVLSNTVISETPSSANKESPESTNVSFQTQANSTVPEKISATQWTDEKPQLPASVDSTIPKAIAASEDDTKDDVTLDESVIIIIQAAIRGFLAQKALLKHKNIVKLQAAVRGHLVRRHAVGTLRCVQAIIKMQTLVRARHACLTIEGSSTEEKLDEKHGKDSHCSKPLGKGNSATKPLVTSTSIEKLLSNSFARQLMESTPKTKSINIKCDPSKSDSAWKWLEMWMSVSSTGIEESQKLGFCEEQQEHVKVEHSDNQMDTIIRSEGHDESTDLKFSIGEAAVPSESEENVITYDADNFDFQACQPTSSSVSHNLEQPHPENSGASISRDKSSDFLPNQTEASDLIDETEPNSLSGKPEMESEQPRRSMKRFAPDQNDTEGKKFVFGSRRTSNPTFVAAQSKFEELSSAGSFVSLNQDVGNESYADTVSSPRDGASNTRETGLVENSVVDISRVQVGGSECGTELSISSTLDSPDRSEVGAIELKQEAKASEDGVSNLKCTKSLDVEAKSETTLTKGELSESVLSQAEKHNDVNVAAGELDNSVIVVDSSQAELKPERNASDLQSELESETGHQAYKSSPEASPKSHITIPESHGTPSSQVSVKAKKIKGEKSGSNHKHRSLSAGKKSPSNPNLDSGARSSSEQLPKDQKSGKRRNSVGSAKPEPVDQEPRDSNSSNSLPSYMQATESARAKALANSSPRSSPDVQDKEIYVKKRHSLPGTNGRQGSPRIQRSLSQAQQTAKGNGTHPPEKKWLR